MPTVKAAHVQVDPLDPENKSLEEYLQLALKALVVNGFKQNGRLWLPLCEAAKTFDVPKSTLAARFNACQTKQEAHKTSEDTYLCC